MTVEQVQIAAKCDAKLLIIRGFCNSCGHAVPLLIDPLTHDPVCKICRSYDVQRKH